MPGVIWATFGMPAKRFVQLSQISCHMPSLTISNFITCASHHLFSLDKMHILALYKYKYHISGSLNNVSM
jgi:hypothetical protein